MASQRMDVEASWTVGLRGGGLDGGCPRIWLSGHKVFPAWCLSMKHFAGEGVGQEEKRGKPGAPRFGNPTTTFGAASEDGHDFMTSWLWGLSGVRNA